MATYFLLFQSRSGYHHNYDGTSNEKIFSMKNALFQAAFRCHDGVVSILLQHGADLDLDIKSEVYQMLPLLRPLYVII